MTLVQTLILALILVAASFFGVAASDIQASFSHTYWQLLALLFFAAMAISAWFHKKSGPEFRVAIAQAALHWFCVWLGILIVYEFSQTNHFTVQAAGLCNGLLFALATVLAGIYSDWRFAPVGMALVGAVATEAYVEEKLWVLLLIAVLALVAVPVLRFLKLRAQAMLA